MKDVRYVWGISMMAGAALLSLSPAFAMEEKGKWIEMKDCSQKARMVEHVDTPVPLQGNTKSLTAQGWKIDHNEKSVSGYDQNYYRRPYPEFKYFPFSYYDYSIVWM